MEDLCDETATRNFVSPGDLKDTTVYVYDSSTTLSWTDATEISTTALSNCGAWTYELTDENVNPLDPSVFTLDLANKQLTL